DPDEEGVLVGTGGTGREQDQGQRQGAAAGRQTEGGEWRHGVAKPPGGGCVRFPTASAPLPPPVTPSPETLPDAAGHASQRHGVSSSSTATGRQSSPICTCGNPAAMGQKSSGEHQQARKVAERRGTNRGRRQRGIALAGGWGGGVQGGLGCLSPLGEDAIP